jgi:hypothetical protein
VARAVTEVGLVLDTDALDMGAKRADESDGQRGKAIFLALAVA